jgi:hypothetical protein
VLAVQSVDIDSSQQVSWKHYDPSNASYRSTDLSGTSVGAAEMDPFGADAGLFKPFIWPQPTSSGKLEPYYGVPELNSSTQGCELDGVPIPCEILNSLMKAGGVVGAQKVQTSRGLRILYHNYENHGVGLYTTYTYKIDNFGEYTRDGVLIAPEDSLSELYKKLEDTLKNAKCAQFAKDILSIVSKKNPVYPQGGTLLDVFHAFLNQPKAHALFTTQLPDGSLGYGNPIGNIRKSTAVIAMPGRPDADGVISELFHLAARNNQYTDKQLAEAVRKFAAHSKVADEALEPNVNIYDPRYKPPPDWTEENQGGYSAYFHYAQFNICFTGPPNGGMKRLLN